MKNIAKLTLLAACLTSALSVNAQTTYNDFSSTAGTGSSIGLVGGNAGFTVANGVANYVVPTSTENELGLMQITGFVGSYTSNWTARIDVYYSDPSTIFSGTDQQAINIGLMVAKTGVTPTVNSGLPGFNSFVVNSNLFYDGAGGYSREARPSVLIANQEPADNETRYMQGPVSGASLATLFVTFNATTKTLVGGFDSNGPDVNGNYTFSAMTSVPATDTFGVAGPNTWSMANSDTFSFYLFGNSMFDAETGTGVGPSITALGAVTVDTFGGLNLTAVPEPSTYAAIAGVLVLGFAAWRRRSAIKA